jgi:hypothetical protein
VKFKLGAGHGLGLGPGGVFVKGKFAQPLITRHPEIFIEKSTPSPLRMPPYMSSSLSSHLPGGSAASQP